MALTISNKIFTVLGNKRAAIFDVAYDDAYAFGGESLTPEMVGLTVAEQVLVSGKGGYAFEYDTDNDKLKVFTHANPIIYEEAHTVPATPFGITLDYPAAAILNVASSSVGYDFIEASDTLAAGEVQLTAAMAKGERTGLTFHSEVGAVFVTYITQAWAEVWNQRVAAAAVATGTHVADLGATVCFIESCLAAGTTGSSKPGYIFGGDTVATTEAEVDFTDSGAGSAGDTTLTFYATDAITGITITYIELPASGFLFDRFLEHQDNTIAAGASAALNPLHPILFHSLGGSLPDYHNAGAQAPYTMQMLMGDAVGTGAEFVINYQQRPAVGITDHIGINDGTADAISLTYVWGVPEEIPGIVDLEARNDTDLSGITSLKVIMIGR